ncbi:Neutrophil cytosol factor 2 [Smittium mucronatum]|uniref:Neutrophil cytosol factor 2 n=1 Tax=Smittium mucronatum TaxID=133383 RepID=A0A1R0H4S0_9FUNG|nr:Neutrophil cytosol factor 2 [Smittium mucronatum]
MALKAEIEQWSKAVEFYENSDLDTALGIFMKIADNSKVHFNIGLILSQKGENNEAIKAYTAAINLDHYLAVAYFQRGVAHMIVQDNNSALNDFNDALLNLRGNDFIDYSQVDLNYKIYACEIIYNRALCLFCLGNTDEAKNDLLSAQKMKSKDRHSWIDKALKSNGVDCPLFCVPKGTIYKPSASKVQSTKKVDYLGNARLIASVDTSDNSTGFKGAINNPVQNLQSSELGRKVSVRDRNHDQPSNSVNEESRSKPSAHQELERNMSNLQISRQNSNSQSNIQTTNGHSNRQNINGQNSNNYHPDHPENLNESPNVKSFPTFSDKNDPNNSSNEGMESSPLIDGATHPDPLDIIKAGLARRVTLNKNRNAAGSPSPDTKPSARPDPSPSPQAPINPKLDPQSRNASSPLYAEHANGLKRFNSHQTKKNPIETEQTIARSNTVTHDHNRINRNPIPNYEFSHQDSTFESPQTSVRKPSPLNQPTIDTQPLSTNSQSPIPAHQQLAIPEESIRTPISRGKTRVKFHFESEIYNLVVSDQIDFHTLRHLINNKISKATGKIPAYKNEHSPSVKIRFVDEDNEQVSMTDGDDFELAKGYAGGDMSSSESNVVPKLELFCSL